MDVKHLPTEPGVYLMKDSGGTILYIGKAKNLRTRVRQYFVAGRDGRAMVPYLTSKVADVETIVTFSEKEALLLENNLIKKHQPQYNVLLKDDKTFISIKINHKHKWPMIRIVRTKGKPKDDGLYFGPYTNALSARDTLELLSALFPLRQCSDRELSARTRPCLLYGIKRCIAPCVGKCTKQEYDDLVKQAVDVLSGKNKNILQKLEKERDEAADVMEFERAGALQKAIEKLEYIGKNREAIAQARIKDCDVFAMHREGDHLTIVKLIFREGRIVGSNTFPMQNVIGTNEEVWETFLLGHYTNDATLPKTLLVPIKLPTLTEILETKILRPERGTKKKLLDLAKKNAKVLFAQESMDQKRRDQILLQLEETLHLTKCPLHIECFDTSNISGSDQVASMVTFTDGLYNKKGRRTYKIRESAGDDYAAMREVLTRRYSKGKEKNDLPDLIIVDGGKGQLNILTEVLSDLDIIGIDTIALTKESARHDRGLSAEKVYLPGKKDPITLDRQSPVLFFLQKIRDEAHRVAISFHRTRRKKRHLTSELDNLPGIGPTKKSRLLSHFGSVKKIKAATPEDLSEIPGLTQKDIDTLKKML